MLKKKGNVESTHFATNLFDRRSLFLCDVIPTQLPKTVTTDLLFPLANMWTVFGRKFLQEAKVKRAKYADFCILKNMFFF